MGLGTGHAEWFSRCTAGASSHHGDWAVGHAWFSATGRARTVRRMRVRDETSCLLSRGTGDQIALVRVPTAAVRRCHPPDRDRVRLPPRTGTDTRSCARGRLTFASLSDSATEIERGPSVDTNLTARDRGGATCLISSSVLGDRRTAARPPTVCTCNSPLSVQGQPPPAVTGASVSLSTPRQPTGSRGEWGPARGQLIQV